MRRSTVMRTAAAATAGGALRAPAGAQTPAIAVGVAQSQDVVASIYARSAGLFAKAGLNVQLVTLVNGGDFKTCKTVEFPASALLAACVEGRLDAYTVGEPYSTLALDSGKVRVLGKSFEAIAPHFLMTGWFSTADYVAKNRDTVERFNRAIADATAYANAHKAEMIPLLAPFLKVDPQVVARTMKGGEGIYLDPATIQPMIDVTVKYGIIDHGFAAADLISPAALKRPRST